MQWSYYASQNQAFFTLPTQKSCLLNVSIQLHDQTAVDMDVLMNSLAEDCSRACDKPDTDDPVSCEIQFLNRGLGTSTTTPLSQTELVFYWTRSLHLQILFSVRSPPSNWLQCLVMSQTPGGILPTLSSLRGNLYDRFQAPLKSEPLRCFNF